MMVIDNKYEIGQAVYLITDVYQSKRMVTGLLVRPGGNLIYELSVGKECSNHYDFEISDEENIEMKVK